MLIRWKISFLIPIKFIDQSCPSLVLPARKNKFSDFLKTCKPANFGPRTLFRTNGFSDQCDFFGPMSRGTNDTLFRTNGFRTNDTFGPMGFWTNVRRTNANGFSDQWVVGPMGCRTIDIVIALSLHRVCPCLCRAHGRGCALFAVYGRTPGLSLRVSYGQLGLVKG